MVKENKIHARSVRMTPTVYEYVNGFEGNGFNEKLENLVLFCMREENELKERIRTLTERENALRDSIWKKKQLLGDLTDIVGYSERLKQTIESACERSED